MIKIDEMESKRFGICSAKITDPNADLEEIDAEARAKNVRMLTTRVDVGNLARVHALEKRGFLLMDTLVLYQRSLNEVPPRSALQDGYSLRIAIPEDAEAVGEVARSGFSGYLGHYHADPRLDSAAADEAYAEWAQTSVECASKENPVLIAEYRKQVAGFLSLRREGPQDIEVSLNAVHPEYQRSGIYTQLLWRCQQIVLVRTLF